MCGSWVFFMEDATNLLCRIFEFRRIFFVSPKEELNLKSEILVYNRLKKLQDSYKLILL